MAVSQSFGASLTALLYSSIAAATLPTRRSFSAVRNVAVCSGGMADTRVMASNGTGQRPFRPGSVASWPFISVFRVVSDRRRSDVAPPVRGADVKNRRAITESVACARGKADRTGCHGLAAWRRLVAPADSLP